MPDPGQRAGLVIEIERQIGGHVTLLSYGGQASANFIGTPGALLG
jgi:hypothetical protein